ncbi:MAG: hypothetical protein ABIH03_17280 [Pseudomonadota bacterium]
MRRVLLFSLPILFIISVIFSVFGIFQARSVQERLIDEVKHRAKSVAESMELSAGQILATQIKIALKRDDKEMNMNFTVPEFIPEKVAYTLRLEKRGR